MNEEINRELRNQITSSVELQRALIALLIIGEWALAADVAHCINAKTSQAWSGPGAGRFFRKHFAKLGSPFFQRKWVSGKKLYKLTKEGEELAKELWQDGRWR
jgi:hypothetical protein